MGIYDFHPLDISNIYVQEVIKHTADTFVFKGHCHIDAEDFPIERILYDGGHNFLIRLLSKKELGMDCGGKGGFYDADIDSDICLSATYTIEMMYKILATDLSNEKVIEHLLDMQEDDKIIKDRWWESKRPQRLLRPTKAQTSITASDASANMESVTGAEHVSNIRSAEQQVGS